MKPSRLILSCAVLLAAVLAWRLLHPAPAALSVVAYVSTDQEIAEPILARFEALSGIRVEAVYDTEATKTAGLAMRLLAERSRPRCDLFWASEPTRVARLAREGVLAPYDSPQGRDLPAWARRETWTAFSSRTRVILVNTRQVPEGERPRRLEDLLAPRWRGQVAIADPRFGTTSAHAAALGERGLALARGLRENGARVCSGNAMVREMVERGELAVGLTDSDDAWAAIDRGMPVALVYPDQDGEGTLAIPNALALVAGGPHPEEARRLADFLLSHEVEERLALRPMRQAPLRAEVPVPAGVDALDRIRTLPADWDVLGGTVERASQDFHRALTAP